MNKLDLLSHIAEWDSWVICKCESSDLNNKQKMYSSSRMGCTKLTTFHLVSTVRESTRFPKIQAYQVSYVDVGDSIIEPSERKAMKIHEISMNMKFCKSQLIRQGNLIPLGPRKLDTD